MKRYIPLFVTVALALATPALAQTELILDQPVPGMVEAAARDLAFAMVWPSKCQIEAAVWKPTGKTDYRIIYNGLSADSNFAVGDTQARILKVMRANGVTTWAPATRAFQRLITDGFVVCNLMNFQGKSESEAEAFLRAARPNEDYWYPAVARRRYEEFSKLVYSPAANYVIDAR